MPHFIRSLFLLLLFLTPPFIAPAHSSRETAEEIIQKMVEKLRSHVNVAHYELNIQKPDWQRTLKMQVWDDRKNNRLFIRIQEPSKESGTAFLRLGHNLWSYLPKIEKVMKIAPSLMLQPWMGSDFSNDDLVKESSFIEDYTHQILSEEKEGDKTVIQLQLNPKPKAPVVWGKVVFKIWKEQNLPLEQSFYDEKGNRIKTLSFQDFKTLDGILMPTVWQMTPLNKEGSRSILKTLDIDFDPKPGVPDGFFSEQNLTRTH